MTDRQVRGPMSESDARASLKEKGVDVDAEFQLMLERVAEREHETKCPSCRGETVQVLRRVWCIRRYDLGGCGGFWTVRR